VARHNEANAILADAQGLDDAIDAITGQAEDDLDVPLDQRLDQHVGRGLLRLHRHSIHFLTNGYQLGGHRCQAEAIDDPCR
jgi:hypothetical protein